MKPATATPTVNYSPAFKEMEIKMPEVVKLGVHIWVSVLIMGTLWRIISYHLIASPNESLVHVGRAMALQY